MNNGYFNFTYQNNSRISVLKKIRARGNIINDRNSWESKKNVIKHLNYSKEQIIELAYRIEAHESCVLFDKDKQANVNCIIEENPQEFLQKLITLCHFLFFMLGISDKLIMPQTLFENYWQKVCKLERTGT